MTAGGPRLTPISDSTGGTIHKVVVDLSGDHYVDLEHEAMAAFKRD